MTNKKFSGDLLWLYLLLSFPDTFFVDGESEFISSNDF